MHLSLFYLHTTTLPSLSSYNNVNCLKSSQIKVATINFLNYESRGKIRYTVFGSYLKYRGNTGTGLLRGTQA